MMKIRGENNKMNFLDVHVDNEHLLSVFCGSDISHPYRFQKQLTLLISFEEFKLFVEDMILENIRWLTFPVEDYAKALNSYNSGRPTVLKKYFLYEISRAIAIEVSLSVLNKKEATNIFHTFTDVEKRIELCTVTDYLLSTFTQEQIEKATRTIQEDKTLTLYISVSDLTLHNKELYRYAVLLRCMAFSRSPEWLNIRDEGGNYGKGS